MTTKEQQTQDPDAWWNELIDWALAEADRKLAERKATKQASVEDDHDD